MVRGSGIDIVEIKKLDRAVKRWGDVFLKRVYTAKELAYSRSKRHPLQHLAARFAAKEAIFKALGNSPKLNFRDIEIINDVNGRPFCRIKNRKTSIALSLSHTDHYAVASAIL
ncbi:holo-[acyl-carrier-protein] synthase [Candidatus Velamenicoccus archaeovorus]|uniref:Holo-[acyl-carrier-protein] synthase n=1 Tax=Velamenicoccus archaeovorus TaxID=1930593 RepID=A0A410P4R8_VELA1|nr:holo-ACP synthase [Candidatus Velamenicoccus archaeovorus]QAT17112.1 holo-[acyl-carrier-protein] synthase [Candidatus Velamenicoccus archaeovorus]